MKRVIITGPTGSIGIALINHLIKNQIEVLAICRKDSRRIGNIPNSKFIKCIELDLDSLGALPAMVECEYDVFYHFGWDGTFGNARNNMSGQLKNIQYTLDAVKVAAEVGCKKFVGAGSQAEYGRVNGILCAETPVFPENGYGMAKLCAGQMSRVLCEQKGIEHVWTRILSVYGPYDGENTMIMSTIRCLLNGQVPPLTKAEQKWDYLYSKDAGRAMYLIGRRGMPGKTYCIGSGKTKSLLDYLEILRDCIDPQAVLGLGQIPYADNQVMNLCADISELCEDTGFTPEYTFEQGIRETIDWYRGRLK